MKKHNDPRHIARLLVVQRFFSDHFASIGEREEHSMEELLQ
jgi:hypothetical protein